MKTYAKKFYEKLIGKCDDFSNRCTQDEIIITVSILIVSFGIIGFFIYR